MADSRAIDLELTPRFPEGTPEHAAYAAELRTELAKFVAGEPPYDQFMMGQATYADHLESVNVELRRTASVKRCYCGSVMAVVNGECRACAVAAEMDWKAREDI